MVAMYFHAPCGVVCVVCGLYASTEKEKHHLFYFKILLCLLDKMATGSSIIPLSLPKPTLFLSKL